MVSGDPAHVSRLFGPPAKKVTAAHHDGHLHAQSMDIANLSSDLMHAVHIDAKPLARRQSLSRQLQKNTLKDSRHCDFSIERPAIATGFLVPAKGPKGRSPAFWRSKSRNPR